MPTGPKEANSTVLTVEQALPPLDDCLYALQVSIPSPTRSSLRRCLQRHGISRLPQFEGEMTAKRKFKTYPIGFFHIDIAEVRTEEGKLHPFVGLDRTSNFAFVELHEKATTRVAADFLRHLIPAVPYRVHTVLTDNGIHFTDPKHPGSAVEEARARERRGVPLPPLRARLRPERSRSPTHQAEAPLKQRPSRTDEPHA